MMERPTNIQAIEIWYPLRFADTENDNEEVRKAFVELFEYIAALEAERDELFKAALGVRKVCILDDKRFEIIIHGISYVARPGNSTRQLMALWDLCVVVDRQRKD